jgi:hypothetical protein
MNDVPKPGTWGAIRRSTEEEHQEFKKMLGRLFFYPQRETLGEWWERINQEIRMKSVEERLAALEAAVFGTVSQGEQTDNGLVGQVKQLREELEEYREDEVVDPNEEEDDDI